MVQATERLLILEPTEESEQTFSELAANYPDLIGEPGTGRSYADLYLIALAETLDWGVVSTEQLSNSPNLRKWKIPDICKERNIEVMQPYHLIQREGWVFNHPL